jgi:hypothetical protein
MKNILRILFLVILTQSCHEEADVSIIHSVNWSIRVIDHKPGDSMTFGTTYLSVYSQIYSQSEHKTHDLTATVSIRNINKSDTIYIKKAEYFNTKGNSIRTYFDRTIFVAPMETIEIVIEEQDQEGGTGANFLFDWAIKPNSNEPFFEGIMISTSGQQGLSFTTHGQKLK